MVVVVVLLLLLPCFFPRHEAADECVYTLNIVFVTTNICNNKSKVKFLCAANKCFILCLFTTSSSRQIKNKKSTYQT